MTDAFCIELRPEINLLPEVIRRKLKKLFGHIFLSVNRIYYDVHGNLYGHPSPLCCAKHVLKKPFSNFACWHFLLVLHVS